MEFLHSIVPMLRVLSARHKQIVLEHLREVAQAMTEDAVTKREEARERYERGVDPDSHEDVQWQAFFEFEELLVSQAGGALPSSKKAATTSTKATSSAKSRSARKKASSVAAQTPAADPKRRLDMDVGDEAGDGNGTALGAGAGAGAGSSRRASTSSSTRRTARTKRGREVRSTAAGVVGSC